MRRIALIALFAVLCCASACLAQVPEYHLDIPPGWVELAEDPDPRIDKQLRSGDDYARVIVNVIDEGAELPSLSEFADAFEVFWAEPEYITRVNRIRESEKRMNTGAPKLIHEYMCRMDDIPMRAIFIFTKHRDWLFVVAGLYAEEAALDIGPTVRSCLESFQFVD